MLHIENDIVAGGGKLSFQNVGGKDVDDVLTLQKSREGKSSPRVKGPSSPPKCSLGI